MGHLLVYIQTGCILGILLYCGLWPGDILAQAGVLAGLGLGGWALATMRLSRLSIYPSPTAATDLVTDGPYAWIRHPMYTAVLLTTGGWVLGTPSFVALLLYGILVVNLLAKARYEERLMVDAFPAYAAYQARTTRFLPYLF